MLQSGFGFSFNESQVNYKVKKIACAHDQSHQQTDRSSIDGERKSNESHAAYIFAVFFFNETLLLQCNFAHSSISVRSRCVVVVYFIVVVLFHRTVCCELRLPELNITNENERHASVLMVPSSFNTCFFFYIHQHNWRVSVYIFVVSVFVCYWCCCCCCDVLRVSRTNVCCSDVEPVGWPIELHFVLVDFS